MANLKERPNPCRCVLLEPMFEDCSDANAQHFLHPDVSTDKFGYHLKVRYSDNNITLLNYEWTSLFFVNFSTYHLN